MKKLPISKAQFITAVTTTGIAAVLATGLCMKTKIEELATKPIDEIMAEAHPEVAFRGEVIPFENKMYVHMFGVRADNLDGMVENIRHSNVDENKIITYRTFEEDTPTENVAVNSRENPLDCRYHEFKLPGITNSEWAISYDGKAVAAFFGEEGGRFKTTLLDTTNGSGAQIFTAVIPQNLQVFNKPAGPEISFQTGKNVYIFDLNRNEVRHAASLTQNQKFQVTLSDGKIVAGEKCGNAVVYTTSYDKRIPSPIFASQELINGKYGPELTRR